MTVVYAREVATGSVWFGNFIKLLARWRGSIYKLVLPDLCVYLVFFYSINFTYRFGLKETENDKMFRNLVRYCKDISTFIPLQFVLGFYVSQIVTRWWNQFLTIPWPDTIAVITATGVKGHDDRGRMMRRTLMRYTNLCLILVFSMISPQARSRFPTMEHLVDAGILLPHEKLIIENLIEKLEGPKYYVPIVWAGAIAAKARKEGRIRDDNTLYHVIRELCKFRSMAGDLLSYDWVCIPLVYTQVVTLATYIYFTACLLGKQPLGVDKKDGSGNVDESHVDVYVPIFHFLEFFFLMGWLKVAETMVNPFGEDDDDFEVNWLIDRNFTVSYMIVDEMNTEFPELVKDQYWDNVVPEELYYTEAALKYRTDGYVGSAEQRRTSLAPSAGGRRKTEPSILGSTIIGAHAGSAFTVPVNHHHHHHRQTNEDDLVNFFDHTFKPKKKDSDEELAKK